MNYDFYGLCDVQGEKLMKRLAAFKKAISKEYDIALNIINDPDANEKRPEIMHSIEDALLTAINKAEVAWKECTHKVIAVMESNL